MTHLIRSCYPDTPIMIQFDDCDWPEKRAYAERVAAAQGWDYHAVEPDFSVWERAKSYAIGMDDLCSPSHAFTQDTFLYVLEAKRRDLGCIGTFLGLRAEESRARKMNILKRGELYQLKSGEWRCYPLGRWTAEDVFAYLTEQEVEINPCYFYNRFRQPEDIRLCYALPTPTGIRYGDMQHLRHYYPQQFQRLREEGLV
jgi:3'-phosphoadenosine 5'-phosphosulfate sulfotransferase (PAPS reductase)/FAD synthetase